MPGNVTFDIAALNISRAKVDTAVLTVRIEKPRALLDAYIKLGFSGSARYGVNYTVGTDEFTFAPGETEKTTTLTPIYSTTAPVQQTIEVSILDYQNCAIIDGDHERVQITINRTDGLTRFRFNQFVMSGDLPIDHISILNSGYPSEPGDGCSKIYVDTTIPARIPSEVFARCPVKSVFGRTDEFIIPQNGDYDAWKILTTRSNLQLDINYLDENKVSKYLQIGRMLFSIAGVAAPVVYRNKVPASRVSDIQYNLADIPIPITFNLFRNGLLQDDPDYALNESEITLVVPADSGELIEATYLSYS